MTAVSSIYHITYISSWFLHYWQVVLSPSIKITKAQAQILKTKTNQKDFVYAIMSMLWSREVLYGHSITGKSSNAYKGKDAKTQLDPEKIDSICGEYYFT